MRAAVLLALSLAALLAGCRGEYASRCEDPERYAHSGEIPPVRVPDDLDVPSEDEALRIPAGGQLPAPQPRSGRGPCLESPPEYFEGGSAAGAEADAAPTPEASQPRAAPAPPAR